jgi:hypothetical protein
MRGANLDQPTGHVLDEHAGRFDRLVLRRLPVKQ